MIKLNYSRILMTLMLSISLLVYSQVGQAAIDTFEFENAQQEKTFHDLTKLLRCPKCQNQNISDSNAELLKTYVTKPMS